MIVLVVAVLLGQYFDLEQEHSYLFSPSNAHFDIGPKFLVKLPDNFIKGITFPDFSHIFSGTSIQYIIMFALVGSLESLLTVKAIDLIDPLKRKANANKDLLAIGIGNTICGLIGGLPMIAEVVRSSANVANGARNRWSNFFHGAFLLIFLLFLPWLIMKIPLSALAAMLVFTGYRLAAPIHFIASLKIGIDQLIIFVITVVFTLATDLLIGILAGVCAKVFMHALTGASIKSLFKADLTIDSYDHNYIIKIKDAAVFSNFLNFKAILKGLPEEKHVIIDFSATKVVDHSFITQINQIRKEWEAKGRELEFVGMDHLVPVSSHPMASRKLNVDV